MSYIGETNALKFGREFYYGKETTPASTSTDTWIEYLSLSADTFGGLYMAQISTEINNSSVAGSIGIRYILNGVVVDEGELEPKDVDNWESFSGYEVGILSSGTNTVSVEFRNVGPGTATIRNSVITMISVG